MKELEKWVTETIEYKETLNDQYRELGNDGRVMWGCGYIQAMKDVLDFINKDENDELPPD